MLIYKYTKLNNTSLTFFQKIKNQSLFSSNFYPIYNHQGKHLKPLTGHVFDFFINQVHQYNTEKNAKR